MPGEQELEHSQSQDSSNAGDDKKLYAGKYKTVEELEQAYKQAERGYHESRETVSRLEEKFDHLSARFDEGYGRGQQPVQTVQQPDNTEVLTRFYRDPVGTLNEVETRAARRAREELAQEQQHVTREATRVNNWLASNQDMVKHGKLLQTFVADTDQRWSIERRLDAAAKMTREYVLELRGKPSPGEPDPEAIVEAPSSGAQTTQRTQPTAPVVNAESQLAGYATERNRKARKPLGMPREK